MPARPPPPLRLRPSEQFRGAVDRNGLSLRRLDFDRLRGFDRFARLRFDRLDVDYFGRLLDRRRCGSCGAALQGRPGEHAQAAAAVALDADEPLLLRRAQQVHQAGEPVAALVEAALGLAENLLHVAQVHRPARIRRGGENAAGALHAFGGAFGRLNRLGARPMLGGWPERVHDRPRRAGLGFGVVAFGRGARSSGFASGPRPLAFLLERLVQFDHDAAAGMLQRDEAGVRELLGEVEERRGAVVALGEGGIELQQRALQQPGLWRHFAIGEDLQRAPHDREGLRDRRGGGDRGRAPALGRRAARAGQVLVGHELVTVPLQDDARERAAADDKHLLVVLFQLFDQREEVAVAADDHVGVDVRMRERHLQRVEREVDIGAVLVAAGRQIALHQADGVLCERAAVLAGARPVGVGDLGDHFAAFLDGVEDGADVEVFAERALDADLDIVEVDEDGNVQTILLWQTGSL